MHTHKMPLQKETIISLTLALVLALVAEVLGNQPVVDVPDFGTIYGETIPFKHDYPAVDKTINAFKGIPFAQNASHYRFMKPEPLLALVGGELNATTYSSICWQLPELLEDDNQSEDCLYLNVWTPNPKPSNATVMVWFHGGAFVIGAASNTGYEGHGLVGYHDVVLVTANYRLNGFGFLSTGDDALPGMYGMYDQLEALKWVNRNIAAFGGDPDNVAIFGQSAGAGSVGLHLMSPESEPYFQRAILMSGVGSSPWSVETDAAKARDDAFGVGEAARCPDLSSSEKLAECLRGLDEKTLTFAIDRILLETTNIIPLVPTVDGAFLPDYPLELLSTNQIKKCPILLGSTLDDGTLIAARAFIRQINVDDPYANMTYFREILEQFTYTHKNDLIVDAMMQEYVDWTQADDPDANYFYDYVELITDEAFACPPDTWARKYAELGQDVFFYQFTHYPSQTVWTSELTPSWRGVAHSEDNQFVFGYHYNPNFELWRDIPQDEIQLTVDMMRFYANFAKTGNPNVDAVGGLPDTSPRSWPRFELPDMAYKVLDPELGNGRALKAGRCRFWNEYVPQLVEQSMDMSDVEQEWREDYSRWKNQDMVAWHEAFDDYQSNTEPCN